MTVMSDQPIGGDRAPLAALVIGWAGVIPFVAGAIGPMVIEDLGIAAFIALATSVYGALVLSFLGGIRWGMAMGPLYGSERNQGFVLSILAPAAGWVALLLPRFEGLRLLKEGEAVEAPVTGGCLSILSSSVGTPYGLEARGRILFIEEIGEAPYRVDRMLHHLLRAGSLDGVRGVVFGEPATFLPEGYGNDQLEHLEHLIGEFAAELNVPVAAGLPSGHTEPNRSLPFGPCARLDPRAGTLEFLEPMVR